MSILAQHIEVVHFYKYLGVPLDEKFYWSLNTDALHEGAEPAVGQANCAWQEAGHLRLWL